MPVLKGRLHHLAPEFMREEMRHLLNRMHHELHPSNHRDAFFLIHPDAEWLLHADPTKPPPVEGLRPIDPTVPPPFAARPPVTLFGIPLHVRDDGQTAFEVQLWVENDLERALRRNPQGSINVMKPPELPFWIDTPPDPTLSGLLKTWKRKAKAKIRGWRR